MARREGEDFFWQGGADLSKLSDELNHSRPRVAIKKTWEPLVDLIEESKRIVIKADLAGVTGEDIDLSYIPERHALAIRGHRPEDADSEQDRVGVYQLEILYGDFEREISLPEVALNFDEIRAIYRNGLLIVLIPKHDPASKQVVIKAE
jgi:HSP20 family protein